MHELWVEICRDDQWWDWDAINTNTYKLWVEIHRGWLVMRMEWDAGDAADMHKLWPEICREHSVAGMEKPSMQIHRYTDTHKLWVETCRDDQQWDWDAIDTDMHKLWVEKSWWPWQARWRAMSDSGGSLSSWMEYLSPAQVAGRDLLAVHGSGTVQIWTLTWPLSQLLGMCRACPSDSMNSAPDLTSSPCSYNIASCLLHSFALPATRQVQSLSITELVCCLSESMTSAPDLMSGICPSQTSFTAMIVTI